MPIPPFARACTRKAERTWLSSVCCVRRNLRRAGTLKNRSRTSTVVPTGHADFAHVLYLAAGDQ